MDSIGTGSMDFNMSWIDNDAANNPQPITSSGSGVSVPESSSPPPGSKRSQTHGRETRTLACSGSTTSLSASSLADSSLSPLDQGSMMDSTNDILSPPELDVHGPPPQPRAFKRPHQDSQHESQSFKRTRKE